jgi:hypothetical protein
LSQQDVVLKSDLDACCSTLSALDTIIKSDVDSVSSTLDSFVYCTLGTQITQAMMPYTITVPGHYYLCESVTPAIIIEASNVYLNLNGFTVSGEIAGNGSDITIENGSVSAVGGQQAMSMGFVTNLLLSNLVISSTGNNSVGADLHHATNLVMKDCFISGNGAAGGTGLLVTEITGGRFENVTAYDIGTGGGSNGGFSFSSIAAVLELINCKAINAGSGFNILSGTGIAVLRNCVASGGNRGFFTGMNFTFFEDCVASDNSGGFEVQGVNSVILKDCIAQYNSTASGFAYRGATGVVTEGSISKENSNGFFVDDTDGTIRNCVFDRCEAFNNINSGLVNQGNNIVFIRSIASHNAINGINSPTGTIGVSIVDSRSQHAATAVNPAYNLNVGNDIIGAGTTVVITS